MFFSGIIIVTILGKHYFANLGGSLEDKARLLKIYYLGLLFWVFVIGIILFLFISCGNKLSKSNCDFDFFENTSGIKFSENVEIIDCYDNLEGIIWLNLKFEPIIASEFISRAKMLPYNNVIDNEIDSLIGKSFDAQLIDSLTEFMNDGIQPITKNQNTYLKTVERKHQYVTYVLNKKSGFFWGLIQYPDWTGD